MTVVEIKPQVRTGKTGFNRYRTEDAENDWRHHLDSVLKDGRAYVVRRSDPFHVRSLGNGCSEWRLEGLILLDRPQDAEIGEYVPRGRIPATSEGIGFDAYWTALGGKQWESCEIAFAGERVFVWKRVS